MRRTVITNVAALLVGALLLVSYLDGWWSDSGPAGTTVATAIRPEVEVPLPDKAWDATSPYPTSTVTLTVGQRLGVRTTGGALQKRWYLYSAGDDSVLRPGKDFVISSCPPQPGCTSEFDLTFSALAPGTTTLTWLFGEGGCRAGVPKYEWERCDISKSIQVTVH
ncbi:hypothetical protein ACFU7Y_04285 [Kitasatospora sp. NPDC057542]|uniref:hypothetical protein n=1 Tax=Kitasatospora sp. NPDC057542 TaxID=3346162 RepID=UPI0036C5C02B